MNMYAFVLSGLQMHERLMIFLGTLLWGDDIVYILSFLSGIGLVGVFNVLIFGFLGNAGCDFFWFFLARSNIFPKLIKKFYNKQDKEDSRKIIKKEKKHLFLLLILSKFFMGTRLITLFYVAKKKELSVKRFFFYNSLAVILWINFIFIILFFVGKSAAIVFSDVESIIWVINLVVFFVIGLFFVYKFVIPKVISKFFRDN